MSGQRRNLFSLFPSSPRSSISCLPRGMSISS
jgi:hypothetical protein